MEAKVGSSAGRAPALRRETFERLKRRWKRELSRPLTVFSLAMGVVLVTVLSGPIRRLLQPSEDNPVRYLVTRYPLRAGHPIQLADLKLATALSDTDGAFSDQELHLIKGARLRRSLGEGEAIRQQHVLLSPQITGLARSVPRGFRAYQLMLSHRMFVNPGDRVDVVSLPPHPLPAEVVAESVEVLQARTGPKMSLLIVAVHRNEIGKLEKAQQRGKLTIALRNPEDHGRLEGRRQKRRKPKPRIEVLTED